MLMSKDRWSLLESCLVLAWSEEERGQKLPNQIRAPSLPVPVLVTPVRPSAAPP